MNASCESCGLIQKLSSFRDMPPCEDCGGTLVPEAPLVPAASDAKVPPPVPSADLTCPMCGEVNPPKTRHCQVCQASLRSRTTSKADAAARRQVNVELGKAAQTVTHARNLFIAFAVFYAAVIVMGAMLGVTFWLAVPVALAVVCAVGGSKVRQQPQAWGLVLAILTTLFWGCLVLYYLVVEAELGASPMTFWITVFFMFMVIAAWVSVPILGRVKRLVEEHPDALGAERIRGIKRHTGGGDVANRMHEKRRDERRGTTQKMLVYGGVLVAGLLVVIGIIWLVQSTGDDTGSDAVAATAAPDFKPTHEAFLTAWRENDTDAIVAMMPDGLRPKWSRGLHRLIEKHGWEDGLPALEFVRKSQRGTHEMRVYFNLPDTGFRTRWEVRSREWRLCAFTRKKDYY